MKPSLTLLVVVLLVLGVLAGCVSGPNPSKGTASEHGGVAGFWLGLWQGFIAPLVFVVSLFRGRPQYLRSPQQRRLVQRRLPVRSSLLLRRKGNRAARRAVKSGTPHGDAGQ